MTEQDVKTSTEPQDQLDLLPTVELPPEAPVESEEVLALKAELTSLREKVQENEPAEEEFFSKDSWDSFSKELIETDGINGEVPYEDPAIQVALNALKDVKVSKGQARAFMSKALKDFVAYKSATIDKIHTELGQDGEAKLNSLASLVQSLPPEQGEVLKSICNNLVSAEQVKVLHNLIVGKSMDVIRSKVPTNLDVAAGKSVSELEAEYKKEHSSFMSKPFPKDSDIKAKELAYNKWQEALKRHKV